MVVRFLIQWWFFTVIRCLFMHVYGPFSNRTLHYYSHRCIPFTNTHLIFNTSLLIVYMDIVIIMGQEIK
ncbi:uncharacterized protein EV154DRAFT_534665 [Mucor mucedo]|uniref:uncharacterized protein n=1 Tax=Mucor mucedo TaxID=29922 RepID=UPI00221F6351|nr:uncharacterized protein EV154DRAFT_534665 [Mucor mucedo]KAI7863510.1 hypothetical protein EV154DRAFT_534665 [Mucor mucedo]